VNYQRIYESLIEKAKKEQRIKHNGIYYENHHITPKCLGGSDENNNLVLLTAKEHYVAHKLLTYIYKGNRKIACSFHFMTYGEYNFKINLTSRDYIYARELLSMTPVSEETKIKMSKAGKGRKFSLEHKNKISKALTGQKRSKESIKKWKDNFEKRKDTYVSPMKGKKMSEESRLKISKARIGKAQSEETKEKRSKALKGRSYVELYGEKRAAKIKKLRSEKMKETNKKRNKC